MLRRPHRPRRAACALLVVAFGVGHGIAAGAGDSRRPSNAAPEARLSAAASPAAPERARYVVQLSDAPLLTYAGTRPGYPATAPGMRDGGDGAAGGARGAAGAASPGLGGAPTSPGRPTRAGAGPRIDLASPAAARYGAYLAARQTEFVEALRRVEPDVVAQYHYRVALNGVTVRLSREGAAAAARMPGVVAVTPEERIVPLMDVSPAQVHAPEAWADARVGGQANAGRGMRIAVIDSGITAGHPFFDDAGFDLPADGDYPQASLTVGDEVTPYAGADLARFTNRKVIVARAYANPEVYDAAAPPNPLADGFGGFHGAHVAGTAAGSITRASPGTAAGTLDVSGIAPGAWIMGYKFTNAYTPEILRMIEDAVADGADVINNSWGTSAMNVMDPERHPVAVAFKAASAAGVVVVAAAGNGGTNGEATLGGPHQMIDEVITVGNVQTGRSFAYHLFAGDTDLPENLTRHPAAYQAFGRDFDTFEAPAFKNDLCNPLTLALGARGKVVIAPLEGACPTSVLPIQLPDQVAWINKLINAALANAAGDIVSHVVLYAESGDPATYGAVLQLLELFKPILEQFLPSVNFPVTAIIAGPDAVALGTWADTHPTLKLKLDPTPTRVLDPALADAAHPTTGQGPAPAGGLGRGPQKPDLAAPGTDILSANTTTAGEPAGYTTSTGTSMASPQVAGAAAVVRQAWPDWTPAEVKAALVTTADPVVTAGGEPAPASVQGAGRLNLARAVDPGLLVLPPAVGLAPATWGGRPGQFSLRLRDVRLNPAGEVTYAFREEPGAGPEPGRTIFGFAPGDGVTFTRPGASTTVNFNLPAANVPTTPGVYEGRIVFASAEHTVRVRYRLVVPGDRKDVLLVNVRSSTPEGGGTIPGLPGGGQPTDTADYAAYWTAALDEAGLKYDVWTVASTDHAGAPPLSTLQQYDLVVLAAGDGNAPLDQMAGGMTSLQMYLLGGGRMLVSGYNYPHTGSNALSLQTSGAMYFLSRYFGGFERTEDDAAPDGDLLPVRPERLFRNPIRLATTTTADAAGTGGQVDLGRPLAALVTAAGGATQAPLDLGIAAPMVVDRVMPYMRTYVEADEGVSAMTGVTADATLEVPARADFIPWRALFAGFGLESVAPAPDHHTRAELLGRVHAWAVEPGDVVVTIAGPETVEARAGLVLEAGATSAAGVEVESWRWDPGDGRAFYADPFGETKITFYRRGTYVVRAEALTRGGHTYVAEHAVTVTGPEEVYLPDLRKSVGGR